MKIQIQFDTTEDIAYDVALSVARAYGLSSVEEFIEPDDEEAVIDDEPTPSPIPGGWTKTKMNRYVKALQPNAKKVLGIIAEYAPAVDVDVVQRRSGLEGYTYAGSMSSFGFAVRNTHGVKEKPFTKVGRSYRMDEAVAQLVLTVLKEA
ncbi:hypothetical protein [Glycomyces tritici]|uniref:HK97 gp10 family phage protein n=1 Tax=Glycomyces tritici TaxID=2665176 RepID=A0ABT7YQH0_9ACTN|nr:hypothetical protein [Glycomyces tritici]MDN3240881.1 hypothetical protein [Glycomyces tritici]MDN3242916.1 hypothetical protein [Glycomyces tritici]